MVNEEAQTQFVDEQARGLGQGFAVVVGQELAAARPGIPMTLENTKPDNAEAARLFLESYPV